jgi:hypothetical protein
MRRINNEHGLGKVAQVGGAGVEEAGGIVHGAPDGVVARGDVAATAGYIGMHNSCSTVRQLE